MRTPGICPLNTCPTCCAAASEPSCGTLLPQYSLTAVLLYLLTQVWFFFFFCLDSEAFPRSQLKARGIYGSSSSSSLVAPPFPFYNPDSDHWNLCLVILSILFPKFPLPWDTVSFPWGKYERSHFTVFPSVVLLVNSFIFSGAEGHFHWSSHLQWTERVPH